MYACMLEFMAFWEILFGILTQSYFLQDSMLLHEILQNPNLEFVIGLELVRTVVNMHTYIHVEERRNESHSIVCFSFLFGR
jgi:heme/copper-type cytochrome/quinol oxidase subunit 4